MIRVPARLALVLLPCLAIAACGTAAPPAAPKAPAAATTATPEGHRLGALSLDLAGTDVIAVLGEPASKTPAEERGVDGLLQSEWTWPARGLELVMTAMPADGPNGPFTVDAIRATAPCDLATDRGVAIGATREQVTAAYGAAVNAEHSSPESIVVDSVYGGVIFAVEGDRVTSIFIGAGAE